MRTYQQFCGVAKALDLVGDRWTLLIVRELLIRGASRYTDLREGLPGVATNLLVDRLRELEEAGLVERHEAPPPVATMLYRLTPRGQTLQPVLRELGRWALPLIGEPKRGDAFRPHWLAGPVWVHMRDHKPERPPITLELRTLDGALTVEAARGEIRTRAGTSDHADLVVSGPPKAMVDVLAGRLSVAAARAKGVTYQGDLSALRRLQPRA